MILFPHQLGWFFWIEPDYMLSFFRDEESQAVDWRGERVRRWLIWIWWDKSLSTRLHCVLRHLIEGRGNAVAKWRTEGVVESSFERNGTRFKLPALTNWIITGMSCWYIYQVHALVFLPSFPFCLSINCFFVCLFVRLFWIWFNDGIKMIILYKYQYFCHQMKSNPPVSPSVS